MIDKKKQSLREELEEIATKEARKARDDFRVPDKIIIPKSMYTEIAVEWNAMCEEKAEHALNNGVVPMSSIALDWKNRKVNEVYSIEDKRAFGCLATAFGAFKIVVKDVKEVSCTFSKAQE